MQMARGMFAVMAAGVMLAAGASLATAQTRAVAYPVETGPAVFETMSAAELQATGIDKLTLNERARLEAWVVRLSRNVGQLYAAGSCEQPADLDPVSDVGFASRIAGDFTGWDGSTVVVLENGQVWQQTSFDRVAVYVRNPQVSLLSTGREWRMEVEGAGRAVPVRRLR